MRKIMKVGQNLYLTVALYSDILLIAGRKFFNIRKVLFFMSKVMSLILLLSVINSQIMFASAKEKQPILDARQRLYGASASTRTTKIDPVAEKRCCCSCWPYVKKQQSTPFGKDSTVWYNPFLIPLYYTIHGSKK